MKFLAVPVSVPAVPGDADIAAGRARRRGHRRLRAGRGHAFGNALDLTAGLRFDHEQKDATLNMFFTPAIAPPQQTVADEGFSNVSPQFAAAFHLRPGRTVYVSVANGYKAGGFNAASPPGSEMYGEEHTWNFEGGVKTMWADGRVAANAAVFHIDWEDLQLNLPNLFVPGAVLHRQRRRRHELRRRVRAERPRASERGCLRWRRIHARPSSRTTASRVACPCRWQHRSRTRRTTRRRLALSCRGICAQGATLYGRAEATFYGAFEYDDLNTERQDAYSLANFRAGVRGRLRVRRSVDPQRVRHALHSGGVRVRSARAVGVHRRDGQAADVRDHCGSGVLR